MTLAVVLAAHLTAALSAHGPVWTDDEIGVLANARVISGQGALTLAHMSYYPGWSIVLAPLWWLSSDPYTVYRGAVIVSALCGAALVLPLSMIARRFGLGRAAAVVVAGVVAVAPGRVVFSTYALTENFLTLVLALSVAAALRYARRRDLGSALLLGAAAGGTFVVHGRMASLLGMTLVWFGVEAWRDRRRAPVLGAAAAVCVAGLGYLLHVYLSTTLYGDGTSRESGALTNLVDADPIAFVRVALGQVWYSAVAWVALALLGFAVVVVVARREWRTRRPDLAWWVLGTTVGTALISILSMASVLTRGSLRPDILTYGRYLDPLLAILAVVGLALLLRRAAPRRLLVRTVAAVTVVVCAVFLPWVLATAHTDAWWGPINVAGLLGLYRFGDGAPPWVAASVVAVVAVVALVLVRRSRRGRAVLVGAVGVYFLIGSALTLNGYLWESNRALGQTPALVTVVQMFPDEDISYDVNGADWTGQNAYQYWLAGRRVQVFDSALEDPPTTLVVARAQWPQGERAGAIRVAASDRDESLWAMPGALADELRARGAVVPADPGARLTGFSARLERVDAPADRPVPRTGGTVTVRATNDGTSSWTPLGAFPEPEGSVRLLVWWPVGDQMSPQLVDLGHSVLPGASIDLRVPLDPPAGVTGDTIAITLLQEGLGELTPPGQPLLTLSLGG